MATTVRTVRQADVGKNIPVYAVWETTMMCNHACAHCGSRAGPEEARPKELTTEDLLAVAQQHGQPHPCRAVPRQRDAGDAAELPARGDDGITTALPHRRAGRCAVDGDVHRRRSVPNVAVNKPYSGLAAALPGDFAVPPRAALHEMAQLPVASLPLRRTVLRSPLLQACRRACEVESQRREPAVEGERGHHRLIQPLEADGGEHHALQLLPEGQRRKP